jgi:hypothetical protein
MALEFQLITHKNELIGHKENISSLFQACFERPINHRHWRWLYIDNVVGEPIVSLCYQGDSLVGHFAVIPSSLYGGGKTMVPIQSLTTMIHSDFRGELLFLKLPQMVFKEAQRQQYQFLIGFPNANLAGPVKSIYKWTLCQKYVALLSGLQIKHLFGNTDFSNHIQLNMNEQSFRTWRLAKPGIEYHDHGDHITKLYEGVEELLYFNVSGLNSLDENRKYKVLLDEDIEAFKNNKLFDYMFSFKFYSGDLNNMHFKVDLLMSDVF